MITMQEMEKELAIYRKNFTAVRLISEADILRTIEARKHNPASRACPCRDGRMTSQGWADDIAGMPKLHRSPGVHGEMQENQARIR